MQPKDKYNQNQKYWITISASFEKFIWHCSASISLRVYTWKRAPTSCWVNSGFWGCVTSRLHTSHIVICLLCKGELAATLFRHGSIEESMGTEIQERGLRYFLESVTASSPLQRRQITMLLVCSREVTHPQKPDLTQQEVGARFQRNTSWAVSNELFEWCTDSGPVFLILIVFVFRAAP